MSKDNYDAETTQAISEAEALQAMFKSSGWQVAEAALNEIINDLQSINTLDVQDQDLSQQVRDRLNTVAALQQWLSDLHGRVENVTIMQGNSEDDKLMTRR